VLLGAAIKAVRAGDRAATAVRKETVAGPAATPQQTGPARTDLRRLPRTAAADTLAALQTAVLLGERMWIGYINAEGLASQRVVDPVKVEGGFVTAYDHLTDEVRTFALHRITGVAEVDEPV
ncbi:WYL domain-containing protein, partial [Saccharothrix sp. ST-888]|uniref:WYL domain-containing protein n=1 Tax=Saccharothrix sp. ST-888 TaxID=1427391 RepID=UPI0005EC83F0